MGNCVKLHTVIVTEFALSVTPYCNTAAQAAQTSSVNTAPAANGVSGEAAGSSQVSGGAGPSAASAPNEG